MMSDNDEAYVEGEDDLDIDWNAVARLQGRFDEVLAIEDFFERREAVRQLIAEMEE